MYLRARLLLCSCIVLLDAGFCVSHASAQDATSAKQFVESLYKLYTNNGAGVPYSGPDAPLYYHSSLIALIEDDQKAVGFSNVGFLDGDPVCSCQDWEGIWDLKVDVELLAADVALASISFALSAPKDGSSPDSRHVRMTLVPEGRQWRIWNVVDDPDSRSPFDMRKALTEEVGKLKPHPRH